MQIFNFCQSGVGYQCLRDLKYLTEGDIFSIRHLGKENFWINGVKNCSERPAERMINKKYGVLYTEGNEVLVPALTVLAYQQIAELREDRREKNKTERGFRSEMTMSKLPFLRCGW